MKQYKTLSLHLGMYTIYDGNTKSSLSDIEVCDLLNELNDENEQLKSRIEHLERKIQRERNGTQKQYVKWEKEAETKIKELSEENEQLKQQLAHHTRMHEWFRNEAYLLQNKLDNREDEIRRLKGDVE